MCCGIHGHRVEYSFVVVDSIAGSADRCGVSWIEATMGITRAHERIRSGATYLDGYGERLEGNDEGGICLFDLAACGTLDRFYFGCSSGRAARGLTVYECLLSSAGCSSLILASAPSSQLAVSV